MRESKPSIAKNLIFIRVFFKRFRAYFLLQIKVDQAIKYKRFLLLNIVEPVVINVRLKFDESLIKGDLSTQSINR